MRSSIAKSQLLDHFMPFNMDETPVLILVIHDSGTTKVPESELIAEARLQMFTRKERQFYPQALFKTTGEDA